VRKQLVSTIEKLMNVDDRLIMMLGDIGVHGCRNVFTKYPDRIYNMGINEQSSIGMMAGLAMANFIPVYHTIAPFMVERALEQIKLDFCYQGLIGQFISVGGSYDYPALGYSHQSPGDVQALLSIPNLRIVVPGSASEFDNDFTNNYYKHTTYYRLSERCHGFNGIKNDKCLRSVNDDNVVVTIGPMLKNVIEATKGMEIDVVYCNQIQPFHIGWGLTKPYTTIIIVSPFYQGTLTGVVTDRLAGRRYTLYDFSIPRNEATYPEHYGTVEEHDKYYGLDPQSLRERIQNVI
jgi:transketolase